MAKMFRLLFSLMIYITVLTEAPKEFDTQADKSNPLLHTQFLADSF